MLGRASGIIRSSCAMGLLGDSASSTTVHRSVRLTGSLKYNIMAQPSIPGQWYAAHQSAGQPAHAAGSRAGRNIWDDAAGSASQATEGQERLPQRERKAEVEIRLCYLYGNCYATALWSCTMLAGGEGKKGRGEENAESMAKKTLSGEKSTTKGKTEVGEEQRSLLLLKGESKRFMVGIQGGGS